MTYACITSVNIPLDFPHNSDGSGPKGRGFESRHFDAAALENQGLLFFCLVVYTFLCTTTCITFMHYKSGQKYTARLNYYPFFAMHS